MNKLSNSFCWTTLVAAVIAASCCYAQQSCQTRRAWSELSASEKSNFVSAVLALKQNGGYDSFISTHLAATNTAHGTDAFLPWHRAFLHDFEVALGQPVPYWDWSGDSQAPQKADVFSPSYFGGNGDSSNNNCVSTGQFTLDNGWNNSVGQKGCLTRCFDQGSSIGPFYSPEPLAAMISASNSYSSFRQAFEAGPHGRVHVGIGGSCGDMAYMYSPGDPIFWLHHSNVDRIYTRWQSSCPERADAYTGDLSQQMPGLSWKFSDAMLDGKLCHSYTNGPSDVPLTPSCSGGGGGGGDGNSTSTTTTTTTTSSSSSTTSSTAAASTASASANLGDIGPSAINLADTNEWLIGLLQDLIPSSAIVRNASSSSSFSSPLTSPISARRRLLKRDTITISSTSDQPSSSSTSHFFSNYHLDLFDQLMSAGENATASTDNSTRSSTIISSFKTAVEGGAIVPLYEPLTMYNTTANNKPTQLIIQHPPELPLTYLQMMKIDITSARAAHVFSQHVVDSFNNQPGYVSPGCQHSQNIRLDSIQKRDAADIST